MRSKVALFVEVRDNFSEGLRFYMSLQEAISHLAQQVGDYSMTRQIQRCVCQDDRVFLAALCSELHRVA